MMDLPSSRARATALLLLSVLFVAAGANHFLHPGFYLGIMPPWLPAPRALVHLSGALEVIGGLAVLVPGLRGAAGWGLVLLLVGVFPANVHMALNPESFPGLHPALLWARLPLQGVLMAWAWWATRPDPEAGRSSSRSGR